MAYAAGGNRDKALALLTPTMDPAEAGRTANAYARFGSASAAPGAAVKAPASRAVVNDSAPAADPGKSKPPGS